MGRIAERDIYILSQRYDTLASAIKTCNAVDCIQVLEKSSLLSYGDKDSTEVRSKLMHFDVVNDGTYERAMVKFGSLFIRDSLGQHNKKFMERVNMLPK